MSYKIKGWNIDYFEEKISENKKLIINEKSKKNIEKLEKTVFAYNFLKNVLKEKDIPIENCEYYFEPQLFLYEYKLIKKLHTYPHSKIDNKHFKNICTQITNIENATKHDYLEKISIEESLRIIHEFIGCDFGKENQQLFKDFFIKNQDYLLFTNDNSGQTVQIDDEIYVSVNKNNNISMTSTIAHEAGHAYRLMKNNNDITYRNTLLEYESFSYEIRLLNWMIKNNIYQKDATYYLLSIIQSIENTAIAKYFNDRYRFYNMNEYELEEKMNDLNLLKITGEDNTNKIYEYILAAKSSDILTYSFSLLRVINDLENPNYLENYKKVIPNLEKINSQKNQKEIFKKDITDLSFYKEYKKTLIKRANIN